MWKIFEAVFFAVFIWIAHFFSFSPVSSVNISPVQPQIEKIERPQLLKSDFNSEKREKTEEAFSRPPPSLVSSIESSVGKSEMDLVSELQPDVLKQCLAKPAQEINPCLDKIFRLYLEVYSTKEALAAVEKFGENDPGLRVSCHPVIHSIGRETFLRTKTVHDSFAACDQTCHSGCYHGAMERFLRGDGAGSATKHLTESELRKKAAAACDPKEATRFRFQCLHGLGHALMYFLDYKLRDALASCDVQPDRWGQSSCYGGVFMENVFSAAPEKRDLKSDDYHYPCNDLAPQYKSDCYMMQTTRMSEMGLSVERLFDECRKAGDYKMTCMQSIGRDLSNDVRIGQGTGVARKCELGSDTGEREACVRGAIYALIDNTWDAKYAFPLCAFFSAAELREYCFSASSMYLSGTYERSREYLNDECRKYAGENSAECARSIR